LTKPLPTHGKAPQALQDPYRDALTVGGWVDKDGVVREITRTAPKSLQLMGQCKACGAPVEQIKYAPRQRQYCDRVCAAAFRARRLKTLVSRENGRARRKANGERS
jgi:hypothetical protein